LSPTQFGQLEQSPSYNDNMNNDKHNVFWF
jgi:hypothetical protein